MPLYPRRYLDFDFHRMDWHWHPELEFLVVQEGTIHCSVGIRQFDLEQGYGLFINRSILHRFEAEQSCHYPQHCVFSCFLAAEQTGIYQDFIHPLVNAAIPFRYFLRKFHGKRTYWTIWILFLNFRNSRLHPGF